MTDLKNYAEALFLIAEEDSCLELIKDELYTVNKVMCDSPEYANLLDTPALSKEERIRLADEAFAALSENVRNTVKLLTEKRQMYAFFGLYSAFTSLYNKKAGIVEVEVISAVKLSDEQISRLQKKLSSKISGKAVIRNKVDSSILGGIILRYDSVQLDGSVKARLDKLSKSLRDAVI